MEHGLRVLKGYSSVVELLVHKKEFAQTLQTLCLPMSVAEVMESGLRILKEVLSLVVTT